MAGVKQADEIDAVFLETWFSPTLLMIKQKFQEGCLKKEGKKVGYRGPTLVSIRNMKHGSSSIK